MLDFALADIIEKGGVVAGSYYTIGQYEQHMIFSAGPVAAALVLRAISAADRMTCFI